MSWNTTTAGGRYLWRLSPLELHTPSGKALLRPLDEADADELHALIEENRALLSPWLPWAAGQTPEDTIEFLRRTRAQLEGNDGFQAAVVVAGSIAGVIGYVSVDWPQRSTSLGYWLGGRHQGKGTMTEAARALVDHAITVWDLNRVEIRAAVDNAASRAIPQRLGFHEEGTLREAKFVDGHYQDLVVYSMLAAEWRERR
jgi:ribosomal-protein-serine acetyltransferase